MHLPDLAGVKNTVGEDPQVPTDSEKNSALALETREGAASSVNRGVTQGIFDAQQLVVLRYAELVATAKCAMVVSSVSPERCEVIDM